VSSHADLLDEWPAADPGRLAFSQPSAPVFAGARDGGVECRFETSLRDPERLCLARSARSAQLPAVLEVLGDARDRVPKLGHALTGRRQRSPGWVVSLEVRDSWSMSLRSRAVSERPAVGLVDDQDIAISSSPAFGLHSVSQPGFTTPRRVARGGDLTSTWPTPTVSTITSAIRSRRAGGLLPARRRQATEVAACRHGADEDGVVERVVLHPHPSPRIAPPVTGEEGRWRARQPDVEGLRMSASSGARERRLPRPGAPVKPMAYAFPARLKSARRARGLRSHLARRPIAGRARAPRNLRWRPGTVQLCSSRAGRASRR